MLKKSASFVLGSSKSSTTPWGYASGFDSPAALPDGLFEHPARVLPCWALRSDYRSSRVPKWLFCRLVGKAHRSAQVVVSW